MIASLCAELRPVRRLRSPAASTALWLAGAMAAVGAAVAQHGPRQDLVQRLADGGTLLPLLAAVATGVLAAFAAFQLAMPDRGRHWALLLLPGVALWLAALGAACLRDVVAFGPAALRLTVSVQCITFITGLGLPLAAAALVLARRAAPLRPAPVAALGGLAAAALASAGLSCVNTLNAAAMILAWHGLAVAMVTATAALLGPALLRARPARVR